MLTLLKIIIFYNNEKDSDLNKRQKQRDSVTDYRLFYNCLAHFLKCLLGKIRKLTYTLKTSNSSGKKKAHNNVLNSC